MWVRGAAIRPVPRYAIVDTHTLESIERELADDAERAEGESDDDAASEGEREDLDRAFGRFEATQPHLAEHMSELLSSPLDDTALALGYFLTIAVWLAFERSFGAARLREVSTDAVHATEQAIVLEKELREARGTAPFDFEDVVASEQPSLFAFIQGHVEAALDRASRADAPGGPREVDVDDVQRIFRAAIVLALCLSHAVLPVDGASRNGRELMA